MATGPQTVVVGGVGAGGGPGGGVSGSTSAPPKDAAWNQTQHGARLSDAYVAFHTTFQHGLPGVRGQLQTLARRPIGG